MIEHLPIPLEALSQHAAAIGKTGSGKTYASKGIVEYLLEQRRRVCIIDPTGVWWGLRSSADGLSPAFPVVVFGGEHGDVPIGDASGERLAQLIAERNMPSVIDLSEFTGAARHRFMTDFAGTLYRLNRSPLHLIIDEADEFAPQNPMPESKRMLGEIDRIVRRGRVKGFRVLMITQRPAVLHKNVLTQANTLIAMRLQAPQDRKAIEEWVKGQADVDQAKEVLGSLSKLQRGEGWVWSPEHGVLERVTFPKIRTFDSSRTPDDGEEIAEPTALADVDAAELRALLAPAQDVLISSPSNEGAKINKPDPAALERAREEGYQQGYRQGRFDAWSAAATDLHRLEDELAARVQAVHKGWSDKIVAEQTASTPDFPKSSGNYASKYSDPMRIVEVDMRPPAPTASIAANSVPKSPPQVNPVADRAASERGAGAELRILKVLAQRHPAQLTEAQWATLAGMKRTGGTWKTYRSRLRTAGYIDEDGARLFGVTAAGIAAAGSLPPAPKTSAEIIEMWRRAVGGGAAKMLDVLVEVYPLAMDRANLADRCRMTAMGGTFKTYLSRLKSNGLVEESGRRIKVSSTLMEPPK